MAKSKVKEAKVPLKGEKKSKAPKASETARAKPSQLSEEVVMQSGSESESGSSGGDEDTESEDENRQNTKKPNVKKVNKTEPTDVPVPDDEEDESSGSEDEDEEDSSNEEASKQPAPKKPSKTSVKTNGVKRKADESSSSEESDEELPDAPEAKKARKESSESEEDSDEADEMEVDKPALPPGVVTSVSARPYEPPSGYTALNLTKPRGSLAAADLEGKQIWHITAPANVPILSLTEVALDAISSGKPVLSHKSEDYVLSEDKGAGNNGDAILLPTKEGYAPIKQHISKSLHLRQHIALPDLSKKQADQLTGSNAAGDVATASVKAAKPQPKGLRMRYRPPGFGTADPGRIGSGSESEEEEHKPVGAEETFQFPKKPEVSGSGKKKGKAEKEKKSKKKEKA